jgi:hypothetical protein
LEGVEACGVGNQLRCVLPPHPLHDIRRISSVRQHAARAAVARELSEADVGIADGDAGEEGGFGLEKVTAVTYCAALQGPGGLFPAGAACFMRAGSPLGGAGLVPSAGVGCEKRWE